MPYKRINGVNGSMRITDDVNSAGAVYVPASGTITAKEEQFGCIHQTKLIFDAAVFTITDALAYLGRKVYDFPEGRILIQGVTGSLAFAVTSTRASTINASASLTWGLGSVTASSITLATTMVDLLPKTTKVLSAANATYNTASTAALATSAQFDGTTTALDAFLNFGFETNTDIDGDGTLAVTGSITMTWINLGDY